MTQESTTATKDFVSLLTDYQEIIRSFIISQVPGSPDVRDILQEVNIVLWEKKDTFEDGSAFGAWACTIARYKILEYRRKKAKDGFLVFSDQLTDALAKESQDRDPATLEAQRNALDHCFAKLSSKHRSLLRKRYCAPKDDWAQFSEESGRSRSSLRVTLCRLRSTLRQCIQKRINLGGGAA